MLLVSGNFLYKFNEKAKTFELEEKQRKMSLETIAHIIMSGQILLAKYIRKVTNGDI